jgi:hypothetical protein
MVYIGDLLGIVRPPSISDVDTLTALVALCKDIADGHKKGTLLDEFRKSAHGLTFMKQVQTRHDEAAVTRDTVEVLRRHAGDLAAYIAKSKV